MELLRHLHQLRILADDARRAAPLTQLLLQQKILRQHAALHHRPLDHQQQVIGIDGLGEKVHRAFFHRRHGILDAAIRGHHDNRQLRIDLLRRFQDAEAVADRQLEVGKHHGRTRLLELLDGGRLIGRFDDDVALRFERMAQHRAERLFVFDEENGKSWH